MPPSSPSACGGSDSGPAPPALSWLMMARASLGETFPSSLTSVDLNGLWKGFSGAVSGTSDSGSLGGGPPLVVVGAARNSATWLLTLASCARFPFSVTSRVQQACSQLMTDSLIFVAVIVVNGP